MSESKEPDWLGELAKGGEALRRHVEPIAQAAEQFLRNARLAKASGRPALPFAQRVAPAGDAGVRELLPPREPVVHHITLSSTITASGGLALQSPRVVALGDVGTGIDTLAVEVLASRRGLATLSDGEILFLVPMDRRSGLDLPGRPADRRGYASSCTLLQGRLPWHSG